MIDYKDLVAKLKDTIKLKLDNYDWSENMKMKCRTYIELNGPNVCQEEIEDVLIEEAIKTFPMDLKEKTLDEVQKIISDVILLHGSSNNTNEVNKNHV